LRSDLLAQIVTDGEPDVLAFPIDADLTMPAVELDGALSHDDYYCCAAIALSYFTYSLI
jgi:hypothetical protein